MNTTWLEQHLLACPVKSLTGLDCPGCGMQRSLLALLHGDLPASFSLYPGLIPVICTFLFLFLHLRFRFTKGALILQGLFFFALAVILVSYVVKEVHFFRHA